MVLHFLLVILVPLVWRANLHFLLYFIVQTQLLHLSDVGLLMYLLNNVSLDVHELHQFFSDGGLVVQLDLKGVGFVLEVPVDHAVVVHCPRASVVPNDSYHAASWDLQILGSLQRVGAIKQLRLVVGLRHSKRVRKEVVLNESIVL